MEREVRFRWVDLENNLTISRLFLEASTPHLPLDWDRFLLPYACRYTVPADTEHEARTRATRAQIAFSLLMAEVSYLIALRPITSSYPSWAVELEDAPTLSLAWVNSIRTSHMATFNPSVVRVGVFLSLQHSPYCHERDLWIRRKIPFWIHYGQRPPYGQVRDIIFKTYLPSPAQVEEAVRQTHLRREARAQGLLLPPPSHAPDVQHHAQSSQRSPSPPAHSKIAVPQAVADARALYDLLHTLPRPSDPLAHEAVSDAFDRLAGMIALLEFVHSRRCLTLPAAALDTELAQLTAEMSTLIALPVLLKAFVYPFAAPSADRTVADMLGLTEAAYRNGCLTGFGRAEECALAVGQRILDVLRVEAVGTPVPEAVMRWLEREVAIAASEQQAQTQQMH